VKRWNGLTVGELKAALSGVDDKLPVLVCVDPLCCPQATAPYMYEGVQGRYVPAGSIGIAAFMIDVDKGFL